ncbi:cytosolic sulfotransferase 14-like [Lotus japonicus]|uniref:cytosolic sulfotransferase 14-like n=1 Tax=Lotus japonicus TaxID=34305 RepID=UPI00258AC16D|nr:cytosolic sulfotransferase 14-like [Lotus japonicus]
MASTPHVTENQPKARAGQQEAKEEDMLSEEGKELIQTLPREKGWITSYIYLYQGCWISPNAIKGIIPFQKQFQAKDSDIVVPSLPKSGTTWLKALTFAIVNRHQYLPSSNDHPLLTYNPHHIVPFFELAVYGNSTNQSSFTSLMTTKRRIFGTHLMFPSLAKSIKENSKCKIIYICRNPFDNFVSLWIFFNKVKPESLPKFTLEEDFERFSKGIISTPYGPIWDHMLSYWNESIARPDKVLFLKYEDLKKDIDFHAKKVAEFLGCPFSEEEVSGGVIENIVKLCSFEKMKELEVNKSGTVDRFNIENKHFFRKAQVGDWVNHLSHSMIEKLSKITQEKLSGSSLSFS